MLLDLVPPLRALRRIGSGRLWWQRNHWRGGRYRRKSWWEKWEEETLRHMTSNDVYIRAQLSSSSLLFLSFLL
jgi:hypothetical protein